MNLFSLAPLVLIVFAAFLWWIIALLQRKTPPKFRPIPAIQQIQRAIGLSVENGTRLHFSLGRGDMLTPQSGVSLAALSTLRNLTERTSLSDKPLVATAGDATLALLAQDSLQAGYRAAAAEELYQPGSGRLSGLSPFSYAAGVLPVIHDESVSASLLLGHFGAEVALLSDAAERVDALTIGASDDLTAQSALFAASAEPLIGEELYATAPYLNASPAHAASLTVQDVLRWLLILALLAGSILKLLGGL
jgi:hypothetical protein